MRTKFIIPLLSALMAIPGAYSATVEDRLSELELKQDLSFMKFGGRFSTSYNNVEYKFRTGPTDASPYNSDHMNLYRLQFSLNLDADLSPKLKFYGRYTTSKYFTQYARPDTTFGTTSNTGQMNNSAGRDLAIADAYEQGPSTYLERAYLNYFYNDYFVFSAGRLPTVDGPPLHWQDGVSREGTYSHLAYSNVLDGVATTFNLTKFMPKDHLLNFRIIFTPFSNVGQGTLPHTIPLPTGNPTSLVNYTGPRQASVSNAIAYMGEYSIKDGKHFSEFLTLAQAFLLDKVVFVRTTTGGVLEVDYHTYSLYTHVTNIFHTGLDFSLTGYMSTVQNNMTVNLGDGLQSGIFANGTDLRTGHALLATTHYRIPVAFLNTPSVGLEYIYGDKHFFKTDPISADVAGFYSTRGHGLHAYYTQPIEAGFKLRVGYIGKTDVYGRADVLREITDSRKVYNKVENFYANLRLDF